MPGKTLNAKLGCFVKANLQNARLKLSLPQKHKLSKSIPTTALPKSQVVVFVCSICPTLLLPICESCVSLQILLPAPQTHFATNPFVVTKEFAGFSTAHQNPRCQAHAFLWQSFKRLRNQNHGQFCLFFCANPLPICQSTFSIIANFFAKLQKFLQIFFGQLGLHTMHKR